MKLSMTKKEEIRDRLLNETYPNSEVQLLKDALGKELMKLSIAQERKKILETYPEFIYGSMSVKLLNFGNKNRYFNLPEPVASKRSEHELDITPYIDELSPTFHELLKNIDAWDKERNTFKKQLESILYSVNTEKQLTELIPETKKYFFKEVENPIIPIDQINFINSTIGRKRGA